MISLGIDIGTSNITVIALDLCTGKILEKHTLSNRRVLTQDTYAFIQDPNEIERSVQEAISLINTPYISIGITGQVHGILYYNKDGDAVSPLYTWLDRRGNLLIDGYTAQERLKESAGEYIPVGYGLLTHYTNSLLGHVPEEAVGITGILEYITGKLAGGTLGCTDESCMEAFGGYDQTLHATKPAVLNEFIHPEGLQFLEAASPFEIAGETPEGQKICFPVGDNQAGFFGMVVRPSENCLVNIGTSGQLSVFSTVKSVTAKQIEVRPYLGWGKLLVGASLSAGKAYEVINNLLADVFQYAGNNKMSVNKIYELMHMSMEKGLQENLEPLTVSPTYNGTRDNPNACGSIENITLDNLTLGNLVQGTVKGIIQELYGYSELMGELFKPVRGIIATGSLIEKSSIIRDSLESTFGRKILSNDISEGAAFGAALIGAIAAGVLTLEEKEAIVSKNIRCEESY